MRKKFTFTTALLFLCILFTDFSYAQDEDYNLVWSEEFNSDSIDTETWKFWEGSAYNNELQYYTDREKNAYIRDGKLYLEAHREDYGNMNYTSARISTDSTRIGWKYGRFEARMKMPKGKGFWPAFWLLPLHNFVWPNDGEIDIMEFRGNEPYTTTGAVHFWRGGCELGVSECHQYLTEEYTTDNENLTEEFHIYALEWTEDELIWYFDDKIFFRVRFDEFETEYNPFSTPFFITLNLAVGGHFLPNPDSSTEFPQALVVDYVRVYQQ